MGLKVYGERISAQKAALKMLMNLTTSQVSYK